MVTMEKEQVNGIDLFDNNSFLVLNSFFVYVIQKPFKFNRRLKKRMASLSKNLSPNDIPINNFQVN
jgi:hypothetical protein